MSAMAIDHNAADTTARHRGEYDELADRIAAHAEGRAAGHAAVARGGSKIGRLAGLMIAETRGELSREEKVGELIRLSAERIRS